MRSARASASASIGLGQQHVEAIGRRARDAVGLAGVLADDLADAAPKRSIGAGRAACADRTTRTAAGRP